MARSLSSSPLPSDHIPITPDPPEIDISQQSTPARTHATAHFSPTVSGEEELRQALMMEQAYGAQGVEKTPGMDDRVDPFMQLFQQMSGSPFQGMENMGGLNMPPRMDIPPGMENMLSGMMSAQRGQGTAMESKSDGWAIWWTLLHAAVAMMVAVGALTSGSTPFDGSEKQRIQSANLAASAKPVRSAEELEFLDTDEIVAIVLVFWDYGVGLAIYPLFDGEGSSATGIHAYHSCWFSSSTVQHLPFHFGEIYCLSMGNSGGCRCDHLCPWSCQLVELLTTYDTTRMMYKAFVLFYHCITWFLQGVLHTYP